MALEDCYTMDTMGLFPGDKAAEAWSWTLIYPNDEVRLRDTSTRQQVFMMWWLAKHKDKFTLLA
jgi:hypothetical protein